MDFQHEKEERRAAAEKQRVESDKQVELSKLYSHYQVVVEVVVEELKVMLCSGNDGSRVKTLRVDWSKPESKRIQVVVRTRPLNIREIKEEAKDIVFIDEINQECTMLCPPGKQNGSARKSITFVFDR